MSDPVRWTGQMPSVSQQGDRQPARQGGGGGGDGTNLADILERVLDRGIVIAGDIQINLLDIELLTIKLRLVVASVDRAKEMGIDWWERDPTLSSGHQELEDENRRLRERIEALEGRDGAAPAALDRGGDDTSDDTDALEDADAEVEEVEQDLEAGEPLDDGPGPEDDAGEDDREPASARARSATRRSGQQRAGQQRSGQERPGQQRSGQQRRRGTTR